MPEAPRRVVVLRGHHVNSWELRAWERLGEGYDVEVLVPGGNRHDPSVALRQVPVTTVGAGRGGPPGPAAGRAPRGVGARSLALEPRLRGADVVHAAELGFWFSWQAARLKQRLGFRL